MVDATGGIENPGRSPRVGEETQAPRQVELLQEQLENLRQVVANLQTTNSAPRQVTENISTFVNPVPTPPSFSFSKSDWQVWITHYERYRVATRLNMSDEKSQINSLLLHMGPKVTKLMETLQRSESNFNKYVDLKQFFDKHYQGATNVIYERAKFNMRIQKEGESAQEYISAVISLAKTCNYQSLEKELVRDRLVVGIRDEKLSESLQLDSALTLDKAIEKITQAERVRTENKELRENSGAAAEKIDRVSRYRYKRGKQKKDKTFGNREQSKQNKEGKEPQKCSRCGHRTSHPKSKCPARDAECLKCKLRGHFAAQCRTRQANEIDVVSESDYSSSDLEMLEIIKIDSLVSEKPWKIMLYSQNEGVAFKIDTGADESVLSLTDYEKKFSQSYPLEKTNTKLVGPGAGPNRRLEVFGVIDLPVSHNKIETSIKCFIVNTQENLLGRPALLKLKIAKWNGETLKIRSTARASEEICQEKEDNESLVELKTKIMGKFPKLFKGLGRLKNYEHEIRLNEDKEPFTINVPRRVPLPLLQEVKTEIDKMIKQDVIEKVEEPTEWCAPMVIAQKKNGKVRVCADFTELNKYVKRERYQLPSVDETLAKLGEASVFSKLDFSCGFWQLKLTKDSQKYTTFISPFGRYAYKRIPFGIASAPEVFQKTISGLIDTLKLDGVHVHADDILITGRNVCEHDSNLNKVLIELQNNGLTLNKSKCEFNLKELSYLGYIVSNKGIKINPDSIEAINKYPAPQNVAEVRKFLGMINYVSKFIHNVSQKTQSIRELLHENIDFVWTPNHQRDFDQLKREITSAPVLAKFAANRESRISADASAYGIGGTLEQLQEDGSWKPICFCSKTLSAAECRYAQIEKEALAITWTCERLEQFLLGTKFLIHTDHKPLTAILATKELNKLSNRLQRFRMRLMKFNYDIKYVPGNTFFLPDALSRAPLPDGKADPDVILEELKDPYIGSIIQEVTEAMDIKQNEDEGIAATKEYVIQGWPRKQMINPRSSSYFKHRNELAINNDFLCYRDRIVIPSSLRKQCLQHIHEGHLGIEKSLARAKSNVWWPGISQDVKDFVDSCNTCRKNRVPPTEPLMPTAIPGRPWATLAADLAEMGKTSYLVVQDYYSHYPEVRKLKRTESRDIIKHLKDIFAHHGIPDVLRTDNGPQFDSCEFRTFSKTYGFKWISSSPRYPQSNGMAENAVKLVKNLLKKNEDPYLALLSYRNTPLKCGASPAQLLFGRKLKERIPSSTKSLIPKIPDHEKVRNEMQKIQQSQELNYNKRHRAKPQEPLKEDDRVWIINMKKEGRVRTTLPQPRSYTVETDKGVIQRNRKHLVQLQTSPSTSVTENASPADIHQSPGQENSPQQSQRTPRVKERPVRSSARNKQPPRRLEDYILD